VAEPTLYLFDGHNILHAGPLRDESELVDRLASFVSLRGARGIVVFDGAGRESAIGALSVRFSSPADRLIERLAAEHRDAERVFLVSSDAAVRGTSGQEVAKLSSKTFLRELTPTRHQERRSAPLGDRLDEETRDKLERMRRGRE
jgi:predicted RNA-binding protein with PIN domain